MTRLSVPVIETKQGPRLLYVEGVRGLVAFVWKQNTPHGNKHYQPGDLVLPIITQGSQHWILNAECMWKDYGCLVVLLDEKCSVYDYLVKTFAKDVAFLGKALGPCRRIGIFTGGGLPHSEAAVTARNLKTFCEVFELCLHFEERFAPHCEYVTVHEGLAMAKMGDKTYKGLPLHTDNNVISRAPEVWYLQGSVTLSPAPEGFARVAVLGARVPHTEEQHRRLLIAVATRRSACETGCIGKGPLDRPAPSDVLGGDFLGLKAANALSNTELEKFIQEKCDKRLGTLCPPAPNAEALRLCYTALLQQLEGKIGTALTTKEQMKSAWQRHKKFTGRRVILMRGIMGGQSASTLYKICGRGAPVYVAQQVWKQFQTMFDVGPVVNWTSNSGQCGKRKVSDIDIQVNSAHKHHRA